MRRGLACGRGLGRRCRPAHCPIASCCAPTLPVTSPVHEADGESLPAVRGARSRCEPSQRHGVVQRWAFEQQRHPVLACWRCCRGVGVRLRARPHRWCLGAPSHAQCRRSNAWRHNTHARCHRLRVHTDRNRTTSPRNSPRDVDVLHVVVGTRGDEHVLRPALATLRRRHWHGRELFVRHVHIVAAAGVAQW